MAEIPALRGLGDELATAYLLNRSLPRDPLAHNEWPEIEVVAQYVFDVRDALRGGDAQAAWQAASGATYWYRDAEAQLRFEIARQQSEAAAAAQLAAAQKNGAKANRAERDSRRQQVRDLYLEGNWESMDAAATAIAAMKRFGKFSTVRGYLRGAKVSTSERVFSDRFHKSETD